jgi:hypothetical protein
MKGSIDSASLIHYTQSLKRQTHALRGPCGPPKVCLLRLVEERLTRPLSPYQDIPGILEKRVLSPLSFYARLGAPPLGHHSWYSKAGGL